MINVKRVVLCLLFRSYGCILHPRFIIRRQSQTGFFYCKGGSSLIGTLEKNLHWVLEESWINDSKAIPSQQRLAKILIGSEWVTWPSHSQCWPTSSLLHVEVNIVAAIDKVDLGCPSITNCPIWPVIFSKHVADLDMFSEKEKKNIKKPGQILNFFFYQVPVDQIVREQDWQGRILTTNGQVGRGNQNESRPIFQCQNSRVRVVAVDHRVGVLVGRNKTC